MRLSTLLAIGVFLPWTALAQQQVLTNSAVAPAFTATGSLSGSSATGLFSAGTLSYSDTGNLAALQASINGVAQVQIQNTNAGSAASADIIVANDQGTASTHYGDFGINSSGFTGSGALNLAGATYLYSATGDLVLGTSTLNGIHFVVNNGSTDAGGFSSAGAFTLGTPLAAGSGGTGVANTGNLTWNAAQTFSFTSGQTMTFPSATTTLAGLGTTQTFSGPNTLSSSPGASTSALTLSGSAYTAGSATTNFPLLAIWPSGATGPSSWSTAGTYFGINMASGFTGNAIDLHASGGASIFKVDSFGSVNIGSGAFWPSGGYLTVASRKMVIGTAVTIASGFCATTPTITSATSASFTVNVGTSCTGAKSGVLTMPTGATNGWACSVADATTNATYSLSAFSTSATSVTVNNYNRTTGAPADFLASDILQFMCMGN